MNLEGEQEDQKWNDNESKDSGPPVSSVCGTGHGLVTELVPKVNNGVNTNNRGDEQPNHLGGTGTTDGDTGQQ
ncbi:hypothetical protein WICPIJ_004825 [Wickerhamomyces pijperi]|uniref:Uncharacterized protein n=1 Tax=Wickerhamomyces pijperi TaxID=599730 RepID=A0A9P8Q4M9_WICPI|nr:hypothetical protein WICPIJ_004825 [Wickerhamomyces pijperi]